MLCSVRTVCMLVFGCTLISFGVVAAPAGGSAAEPKPAPPAAAPLNLTDDLAQSMAEAAGVTSDVVRAAVDFLNTYKPREARELDDLLKKDREKFRGAVRQAGYEQRNLEALQKSDPAAYSRRNRLLLLQAKADELVERYKTADENEKPRVEVELAKVFSQEFDVRIEEEQAQLDQLRKQMERTAERIKDRVENKDRIVDRQVTRILGIDDVLVW